MSDDYTYDPRSLNPILAGLAAGSVGATAASLIALPIHTPDELVANSLTITIASLVIGALSGLLWRRIRATSNATRTFALTMVGAFIITMMAAAIIDQTALDRFIPYAGAASLVIFLSIGLLTPVFSRAVVHAWVALIPVVIALMIGVGLVGRGTSTSGDLSLDDLETTTTAATTGEPAEGSSTTAAPASDTADEPADVASVDGVYVVDEGVASYTVPETLRGLQVDAVGISEMLTGSISTDGSFEFELDLTTFVSDQSRRDSRVAEIFSADPLAVFVSNDFMWPDGPDGTPITFDVTGTMTVNSTERELTWQVEARKDGETISATGEADITLTEFGIEPPSIAGFVNVEDEARLEVLFQATKAG
ncbi:MAG: YceI family protein [Acidimicrobiia bacterium]